MRSTRTTGRSFGSIAGWILKRRFASATAEDLLQVLAYSTLSDRKATTACLAYPCTPETWNSLKDRGMLSHRGAIYAGRRKIDLVLVAVPIGNRLEELVDYLGTALAA